MLSSSGAIAALIHQLYDDTKCFLSPKAKRRRMLKALRDELEAALKDGDLSLVVGVRHEIERVLADSRRDS